MFHLLIFLMLINLFYVLGVLSESLSVHHMCVWCPSKPEEGFDPLDLELEVAVSYYVGARTWTGILWKNSKRS